MQINQFFFVVLTLIVTGVASQILRDAKVIERLNSRSGGCGTSGNDDPTSCCGHPHNYGPPCNCGLCKIISNLEVAN